jgi:hypothetical protein
MWALLHDLLVRCGCDQHDGTEFALRMLRSRLRSIAAYHGAEPAREEYHRIRDALLDYEDECETWLEETETGDMAAE